MVKKYVQTVLCLLILLACTPEPTSLPSPPSSVPVAPSSAPESPSPTSEPEPPANSEVPVAPSSAPESPSPSEPEPAANSESQDSIQPNEETRSQHLYLSYSDSASTAGVELIKFYLQNQLLPPAHLAVRPWQFLNYETFMPAPLEHQQKGDVFTVAMGLRKLEPSFRVADLGLPQFDLGLQISAPHLGIDDRQNVVLTLIVDASLSMNEYSFDAYEDRNKHTRYDILKHGLKELWKSLKKGDIVNLVEFSHNVTTILENHAYDPADQIYLDTIQQLQLLAGSNLEAGVNEGYRIARQYYDPTKINRVIILTDAHANSGSINPSVIAENAHDQEGKIYFSGLGLGSDFQEAFLHELTEAGRGAYFAVITKKDAERVFGERFMSLINVAARNVQFRLDFPSALRHGKSAAQQVSSRSEEVDLTNFSYNTSQYFMERFTQSETGLLPEQTFRLTIHYQDPQTGQNKQEVFEKPIEMLLNQEQANLKQARLILHLSDLLSGELTPTPTFLAELDRLKEEPNANLLVQEYLQLIDTWLRLHSKENSQ